MSPLSIFYNMLLMLVLLYKMFQCCVLSIALSNATALYFLEHSLYGLHVKVGWQINFIDLTA